MVYLPRFIIENQKMGVNKLNHTLILILWAKFIFIYIHRNKHGNIFESGPPLELE